MSALAAAAWPLIDQMNPSASVLALSSIEFDLSPIKAGQQVTVTWRGKPVSCAAARRKKSPKPRAVPVSSLIDPLARNANLPDDAPATDHNREIKAGMADSGRRVHPSRLHADRLRGRLRRLALPLPRFAIRYRRPHPQRTGAAESGRAAIRFPVPTRIKIG